MSREAPKGILKSVVLPIALILSIFQLYTGGFGVLTPMLQRGVHITLVLILVFLLYPISRSPKLRWLDFLAAILALANGIYIYSTYKDLLFRVGAPNVMDQIFAAVTVILMLEATRRLTGWILTGIGAIFLVYAFFGEYFPGIFQTSHMSYNRIISLLYLSTDGIWGETLGVAASFVALFILFGAFLEATGAGKIFIDLAFSIGGRFRGGPAKVAILGSGLMGTVSGSPVANVTTVGTFTIPLMKRVGYQPWVAAGIEAVGSTGGSIMPPVMGAGAFVMAQMTGIPYNEIVIAAIIPAILYYVSLFFFVDFEAGRLKMSGLPKSELPPFKKTLFQGLHLYVGLITLIYLLVFAQVSPMKAAFWSIVALVVATLIFYRKSVKWDFLIKALESGAKGMLMVSVACATAGVVVGVINLTGLGVTLTSLIVNVGQSSLFLTLIITMICCLVMGMGLPPTASYIVLGVLTAPALIKLGLPPLVAHMFVFYFTCFAPITPPVALAAYAGAGIAGCDPTKTGFTAARIGFVAFLIPYMFVYGPAMLAQGNITDILVSLIAGVIGVVLLAACLTGWVVRNLNLFERLVSLAGALLLIKPGLVSDLLGLVALIILGLLVFLRKEKLPSRSSVAG